MNLGLEELQVYRAKLKSIMAECNTQEVTVKKAGYYHIGHFNQGRLEIMFNCAGIYIKNTDDLNDLFYVFGIDSENGKYLQELEGKSCIMYSDKDNKIRALKHLSREIYWTDGGELLKWKNKKLDEKFSIR